MWYPPDACHGNQYQIFKHPDLNETRQTLNQTAETINGPYYRKPHIFVIVQAPLLALPQANNGKPLRHQALFNVCPVLDNDRWCELAGYKGTLDPQRRFELQLAGASINAAKAEDTVAFS